MIEINKIYLGNCLDIMKNITDNTIDLIVTDPPYLINYKTNRRKNKNHDFCTPIQNDNNPELISKYIKECYRILKNNTAIYIFCNSEHVDFFKQELEDAGFNIKNMIIWVKNNHTAGDLEAQFGKQYEIIFLANKGKRIINGNRISDVWGYREHDVKKGLNKVVGDEQIHQNQKPLALITRCILKHSNEGDIIFDGFLGSGTTALAATNNKRKYIGIEIEKEYYEKSIKRIETHKYIPVSLFS